jgi:uncharacterized protein (DUF488 family)
MPAKKLLTIGHSGHTQGSFVRILQKNKVKVLVDVRRHPGSAYKPDFSKNRLADALRQHGIEYRHMPSVAPTNELRGREKDGEIDRAELLVAYEGELVSHLAEVDKIRDLAERKTTCLMCLEKTPQECHRHVLGRKVVKRSRRRLQLEDIGADQWRRLRATRGMDGRHC